MKYCERHLCVVRALQISHPWTAAGMSAVEAHGLPHPYSSHEGLITVASTHESRNSLGCKRYAGGSKPPPNAQGQPIRRIFIRNEEFVTVRGVRATPLARTVVDAVMLGSFELAMGVVNGSLRQGLTEDEILECCETIRINKSRINCALSYANPRAENGGESLTYSVLIRAGFVLPELQHEFTNYTNPDYPLRTDFLWETEDGRIIVLEYDGLRKYHDPAMTRRSMEENITRQAARDKMLLDQGVTHIIHCYAEDIYHPAALIHKLEEAGVPKVGKPRRLPF